MTDKASSTPLGKSVAKWLAHQRALGRRYDSAAWILHNLERFVVTQLHVSDLDQAGFVSWCESWRELSATTRRGRQLIVRKFCLYRQRTEPGCFVPNPLYFARQCPYRPPLIITPEQVAQMLAVADTLSPTNNSPLLPAIMRLAVVILYTAGLRRGELVRLNLNDVDLRAGLIRIHASKFHKSRLVPLSSDARTAMRTYLRQRLTQPFPGGPNTPLLCNHVNDYRRYTGGGLGQAIARLFIAAKVVDREGRRPRVQDLRHSFAVQALIRWYQAGGDVQSNLPRLAMYMGHVSIISTAHYLHFIPQVRELASERFEAAFGNIAGEAST
jgi:integrase/recombinase XerD